MVTGQPYLSLQQQTTSRHMNLKLRTVGRRRSLTIDTRFGPRICQNRRAMYLADEAILGCDWVSSQQPFMDIQVLTKDNLLEERP